MADEFFAQHFLGIPLTWFSPSLHIHKSLDATTLDESTFKIGLRFTMPEPDLQKLSICPHIKICNLNIQVI